MENVTLLFWHNSCSKITKLNLEWTTTPKKKQFDMIFKNKKNLKKKKVYIYLRLENYTLAKRALKTSKKLFKLNDFSYFLVGKNHQSWETILVTKLFLRQKIPKIAIKWTCYSLMQLKKIQGHFLKFVFDKYF